MLNTPVFSVIIPLYNKENYIENTLKSVINQSFQDFEIIIINDGSTDESLEKIKVFHKDFKKITIKNQKNKGLSAARNIGILAAKGEIIALIDADDLWNIDFLKSIYNLYLMFPETSIFGTDYFEKYSETNILRPKKNININLKNKSFIIEDFFLNNKFQPIVCQSSIAFKKEISNNLLFNETINYAEDVDFYIKAFLKYKIAYQYTPLAVILFGIPNQITQIGIKNKKLPDLNFYEKNNPNNLSLKKYLDFKRYMYASQYKLIGDKMGYNFHTQNIDYKNLTTKQLVLLKSPFLILKLIKYVKKVFLKYNIRLTTFKN
jgi:glycosyltransferase involved in cell wall biosynthesis